MLVFEEEYRLLSQEGHLTKSSLLSGLDAIRRANIDDYGRGFFYSGLFELSIGFERLMKIVIVLQHKLENKNNNPTNKQLRLYGHNIIDLYRRFCEIASKHDLQTEISDKQKKILDVLSIFGTGSRYYNLDQITDSSKHEDPLKMWSHVLSQHIWGLNANVRKKLEENAFAYVDITGQADAYYHGRNINGELMMVSEYHYLYHATEKANYQVVWSIVSMLEPFYGLLYELCHKLHRLADALEHKQTVPFMYEFFPFFLTPRSIVVRKKRWSVHY
ncbi:hypothetical protein [Salinivibrio sp. ML290]|uniref:hypothetical protein n=1 Tax=Salinivibrio sp. ML290 TaxID=1909468 RepID=UPI0009884F39|nr:hypothetical protein [Salinivibrio sp. ML290]OOE72070.1 hypothetical protein BZG23_15460 [Salinivibrio sp. ML290]